MYILEQVNILIRPKTTFVFSHLTDPVFVGVTTVSIKKLGQKYLKMCCQ
jgi:hypothetical protein